MTDVDHEGTRKGPDTRQLRQLCGSVAAPFCVAGGIARLEHLHALAELSKVGVVAAVLDAALYRDYFNVAEAMAAAEPRYDPYQWGPAQPLGHDMSTPEEHGPVQSAPAPREPAQYDPGQHAPAPQASGLGRCTS